MQAPTAHRFLVRLASQSSQRRPAKAAAHSQEKPSSGGAPRTAHGAPLPPLLPSPPAAEGAGARRRPIPNSGPPSGSLPTFEGSQLSCPGSRPNPSAIMQASDRFNINSQLEHLQAKYVGTGHADLNRLKCYFRVVCLLRETKIEVAFGSGVQCYCNYWNLGFSISLISKARSN
uniref:Uncharacterized protein n=1 Tax=Oryza rufipogon TaxID=4529 RepID=A0A0E0QJM9_ORYRU